MRRLLGSAGPARGVLLMLVSVLAVALMTVAIRHVTRTLHPFQGAFLRSLFGFLMLAPFFLRAGAIRLDRRTLGLYSLRGALQAAAVLLSFAGLSLTPVAKATALQFTMPLFSAVLAIALLGEAVRISRVAALVVGFAGAMIIVRPGVAEIDPGALLILASSLAMAAVIIVIALLSRTDSSLAITFYMGVFTTPFTAVFALAVWETPSVVDLLWTVVLGFLTNVINFTFAQAVKEAELTAILPLDFTKLLWTALFGFLAFGEVPDVWTWLGGTVIFAANAYLTLREGRAARSRPAGPA